MCRKGTQTYGGGGGCHRKVRADSPKAEQETDRRKNLGENTKAQRRETLEPCAIG